MRERVNYIEEAIHTYTKDRSITRAPGIVGRILRLFDELARADTQGLLAKERQNSKDFWASRPNVSIRTIGTMYGSFPMAYYSLNYAHSRACQWELTAAFLAARREGDPRQRVLIINPKEMAEHIHLVELRDELFRKAPADPQAIDSLVSSIETHISTIESTIGDIKALIKLQWFPTCTTSSFVPAGWTRSCGWKRRLSVHRSATISYG